MVSNLNNAFQNLFAYTVWAKTLLVVLVFVLVKRTMSQGFYRAVSFKSTYGFPKQCPDFETISSTNQTQDQLQTDYYSCLNDNAQKFKMDLDAYLDSAERFCCFVKEALKCETETLTKCDKNFAALNTVQTESLLNYSCSGNLPADCSKLDASDSSDLGLYIGIGIAIVASIAAIIISICYCKSWWCFNREAKVDKLEIDGPILGSSVKIPEGGSWPPSGLKEKMQLQLKKVSEISDSKNSIKEQIEVLETKYMELDNDPEAAMADMKANPNKWYTAIEALEANDPKGVREELSRLLKRAQELEESFTKQLEEMQIKISDPPTPSPEFISQDSTSPTSEEAVIEDLTTSY